MAAKAEGDDADAEWEMLLFKNEALVDYLTALEVEKSVYEYVPYDSEIARVRQEARRARGHPALREAPELVPDRDPVGQYNLD